MNSSSHATSEFSSHPHLSVASRCTSTGSEYLPSTAVHDAHTHFFVIHPRISSMIRTLSLSCHTPFCFFPWRARFFLCSSCSNFLHRTTFSITTKGDVARGWSTPFPWQIQARRLSSYKQGAPAVASKASSRARPSPWTASRTATSVGFWSNVLLLSLQLEDPTAVQTQTRMPGLALCTHGTSSFWLERLLNSIWALGLMTTQKQSDDVGALASGHVLCQAF